MACMESLPEELVLHILSYLPSSDLILTQRVSRRFFRLARDAELWKHICFSHSRAELQWRRARADARQANSIAQLSTQLAAFQQRQQAGNGHGGPSPSVQIRGDDSGEEDSFNKAVANWDPTYPSEKIDFYREFVHRQAPFATSWFQAASDGAGDEKVDREVLGMGILRGQGSEGQKLVGPLDDGSVCLWELSDHDSEGRRKGSIIARSQSGILTCTPPDQYARAKALMTETGAVESVSIDSVKRRGYFAAFDTLAEVDLDTLEVISRTPFPFPITALSKADEGTLTVGTNQTLHIHDTRTPSGAHISTNLSQSTRTDPINGLTGDSANATISLLHNPIAAHPRQTTLSQPGPLSILHVPPFSGTPGSIWVTGRFTHLLNYSRRQFPRLHGTIASGARISSSSLVPWPYLRRTSLGTVGSSSGANSSILAGGEYKGKGSLELYSLSPDMDGASSLLPQPGRPLHTAAYQNRQTAARAKILSAVPHLGRIAYASGDGLVRWVERDGTSFVREWRVHERKRNDGGLDSGYATGQEDNGVEPGVSTANRDEVDESGGEVVQKLLPFPSSHSNSSSDATGTAADGDEGLLFWTGEGALGLLGFGFSAFEASEFEDTVLSWEERERRNAEWAYGVRMRRALERQANEVRFVRGLGLEMMGLNGMNG